MENEGEMSIINNLDDESLQELYTWIDEIPLSRPKRNIARDFSDGVLVAEIVNHFLPKMVELHNYSAANSVSQKKDNWTTLQRKVLGRLEYKVADELVDSICKCRTGAIEIFLLTFRNKIDKYLAKRRAAALRKQHQVYDEFSTATISDTSYGQDEGYANAFSNTVMVDVTATKGGAVHSYGYVYNTMQETGRIPYVIPSHHEYYQVNSYDQQSPNSSSHASKGPQNAASKRESVKDIKHSTSNKPSHHGAKQPRNLLQQDLPQNVQLLLEEKEQSLLASQETIQILQVKVRRLEHLLHLKDMRIEDLTRKLQQATQPPPKHLPPQHNPPVPPISGAAGQPLPRMHSTPPLPPVKSPPKYNS